MCLQFFCFSCCCSLIQFPVSLQWVPAHVILTGNGTAVKLTKIRCQARQTPIPVTYWEVKTLLWRIKREWKKQQWLLGTLWPDSESGVSPTDHYCLPVRRVLWSDCTSEDRGHTYAKKLRFFTQKKSRLRKSENAVRLLYAKNSDLIHQNAFSLFVFCTQQRRFVEYLPWV